MSVYLQSCAKLVFSLPTKGRGKIQDTFGYRQCRMYEITFLPKMKETNLSTIG